MAKNDSTKNKAELYREERKQRIAKANKKNARSIEKSKTVGNIVKKVVAVVVVAAIVCGGLYYVVRQTGLVERFATAVKVNDARISVSEFNYYYSGIYSQMNSYAQMYAQYGYSGFDYDTSLAPDEQKTTDADGNEITYAESFRQSAIKRAQYIEAYSKLAEKEGFKLGDDEKAEIDEAIENYKKSASESGYSLNAYLKANFGAGLNEKKFREQLEKEEIASHYSTHKQEELAAAVPDDEVKKEYEANKKDYDYIDVRYYTFSAETLTAEKDESDDALAKRQDAANKEIYADAKSVFDKANDIDAFEAALADYEAAKAAEKADDTKEADKAEDAETAETEEKEEEKEYSTESLHTSYSALSSSLNDKAADWAYEAGRKAGDKKLFEDEKNAYIVFVTKPAYTGNSVDVRQLLVKYNAADENNVTNAEKKAAREQAEAYLEEWKSGDATEDSFSALATDHTEDTASAESGGLYAGVRLSDSYVPEFLDWCFDPSRKEGDVGIIETTYGYHIMYFSKNNADDLDWQNKIRTEKGEAAFTEFDEALVADDGENTVKVSEFWTKYVAKEFSKRIKRNIAYSSK